MSDEPKKKGHLDGQMATRKAYAYGAGSLSEAEQKALIEHKEKYQDVLTELLQKVQQRNEKLGNRIQSALDLAQTSEMIDMDGKVAQKVTGVRAPSIDVQVNVSENITKSYYRAIEMLKEAQKLASKQTEDIKKAQEIMAPEQQSQSPKLGGR